MDLSAYNVPYSEIIRRRTVEVEQAQTVCPESGRKLAAVLVTGQVRSLMSTLNRKWWHYKSWGQQAYTANFMKRKGPTMKNLKALGHPPPPFETVADNIQRNVFGHMLGSGLGRCGMGFDVFWFLETRETDVEPKVGDTSVCEPLRPQNCPRCSLICHARVGGYPSWSII